MAFCNRPTEFVQPGDTSVMMYIIIYQHEGNKASILLKTFVSNHELW